MPNDMTADLAVERAKIAAEVWEKAAKIRIGMLATRDGNQLTSRPMTIQQIDSSPMVVWFFTGRHGNLAESIGSGAPANLSVSDHGDSFYVSIAGDAKLVDDRDRKEALWSTMAKAWFPGGVDDPNLALIALEVHNVEYWDSDHSKMVQMLMMAKAAVTGDPPTGIGTHGSLDAAPA
jgi:general stress protein 26